MPAVARCLFFLLCTLLRAAASPIQPRDASAVGLCKPRHGDPGWPPAAAWSKLNATVGGRLTTPAPLAAACYGGPGVSCDTVLANWNTTSFRADDPTCMQAPNWELDACIPPTLLASGAKPGCDASPFPRYVVRASSADDVVAAVKFAASTGVRLVVRATGHDYLGR